MADVALHFRSALLPSGWSDAVRLTLFDGRIARVETGVEPDRDDRCHAVGLPGVANLHSHAFQRAMAGLAEMRGWSANSFWTWREAMYRFAHRMTPDDAEAVAAQAYMEMLESGFSTVAEFHYLHHSPSGAPYDDPAEMAVRIIAAANTVGIGLTLLPVFYSHGGFGGQPIEAAQRRFACTLDGYGDLVTRCRAHGSLTGAIIGTAPHSLRAVLPEHLPAIAKLADGGPIHIHIAEQIREVSDCRAWSGARPVELLLDTAHVDRQWCLIHATHMTSNETERLARSEAVAGLCPETEANLGDGIMPAAAFVQAGGRFGIGTDSNVRIGLADELRMLEYGQRLDTMTRNVLAGPSEGSTGGTLYRLAHLGGAQATGTGGAGLEAGAPADIVSLRGDHPALIGRSDDQLIDGWIFAARAGVVDRVWRAGQELVTGGIHRDATAINARYATTLRRLLTTS